MKVILVGYGRMGKMIGELLAARADVEILGAVSPGLYESPWDIPSKPDAPPYYNELPALYYSRINEVVNLIVELEIPQLRGMSICSDWIKSKAEY